MTSNHTLGIVPSSSGKPKVMTIGQKNYWLILRFGGLIGWLMRCFGRAAEDWLVDVVSGGLVGLMRWFGRAAEECVNGEELATLPSLVAVSGVV